MVALDHARNTLPVVQTTRGIFEKKSISVSNHGPLFLRALLFCSLMWLLVTLACSLACVACSLACLHASLLASLLCLLAALLAYVLTLLNYYGACLRCSLDLFSFFAFCFRAFLDLLDFAWFVLLASVARVLRLLARSLTCVFVGCVLVCSLGCWLTR